MNKQEVFYSCMTMPEAQLLNLIDFEFKERLQIEIDIVEDWIKNKRCKCTEHQDIQSKKFSLDCEHLNEEIEKKIKEKKEKIEIKCNALNLRSLCKSERFLQRFHSFKI